jgi:hypothetical protein
MKKLIKQNGWEEINPTYIIKCYFVEDYNSYFVFIKRLRNCRKF